MPRTLELLELKNSSIYTTPKALKYTRKIINTISPNIAIKSCKQVTVEDRRLSWKRIFLNIPNQKGAKTCKAVTTIKALQIIITQAFRIIICDNYE